MSEELETVLEHCTHPDCIYRGAIDAGYTPVCLYCLYEYKARGCKISECDKYRSGKKVRAKMKEPFVLYWEVELNERAIDHPDRTRR